MTRASTNFLNREGDAGGVPLPGSPPAPETALSRACRRLHEEEGGMVTMLSVVVLLFFLLLANLVWNMGWTSTTKMGVQNSSDATAYSSALWMARGMNAITATNHVMGEMMSFVVISSALGEKHPKRQDHSDFPKLTFPKAVLGDDPNQVDRFDNAADLLTKAYEVASKSGPVFPPFAYDIVNESAEMGSGTIEMGSTISDGRYNLIKALTINYAVKFVASILEKTVIFSGVGLALDGVTLGVEVIILAEWFAMKGLEGVYTISKQFEQAVWAGTVIFPRKFQRDFVGLLVPIAAQTAAIKVAKDNGSTGAIYPSPVGGLTGGAKLQFFLEDDPWGKKGEEDGQDEFMRKSQIVRATYPWVKYHRRPLVTVMNLLKFSNSAYNFVYWTNDYTLLKTRDFYKDKGSYLAVLEGSDPTNKGSEPWTTDQNDLEKRFAVVAFAHRKPPTYSAPKILGSPIPEGMASYSMALVYNANLKEGEAGAGFQPNWGWDTLNWELPTDASHAIELPEEPDPLRNGHNEGFTPQRPKIKLNWQAKLVPASRFLEDAIRNTPGDHQAIMTKMLNISASARKELLNH